MPSNDDIDTRQQTSLFEAFEEVALGCPKQVAFKADGGNGKHYTYCEVAQLVRRLANGLAAAPYADCDEIGLLSENRPEWCLAYLAVTAAGKTVVPIDANLKPAEIGYILGHARLKALFASGRFEGQLTETYPHLKVISFEKGSSTFWRKLLTESPPEALTLVNPVAALIYTSGTTGSPKAVQLTHRNLLANIEGVKPSLPFDNSDIFLSILPLHHTFEATCGFLVPLMSGSTIIYARSLKSKEIKEDIEANRVTVMSGVPLLYEKLYHSIKRGIGSAPPQTRAVFKVLYGLSAIGWMVGGKWGRGLYRGLRRKAGLRSIRMFVAGGAALPPHICRFFNLLGLDMLQGYGMTECSPVISVNRPDNIKFGSVGLPLKNVQVRIDRPDSSGVGEILIKGDNVTPGYRNDPEKNAELLRDGWLHTGDLGRLKDGHLWITGRKKNLIVSAAGKNIYPEQIEEMLLQSDFILESVAFGRRKAGRQGEEVCAIIVPDLEQFQVAHGIEPVKPDRGKIESVIRAEVNRINRQMADYKRVSDFQVRLEELEKTSSKKVKRFIYKQGESGERE
ncbi:MAG: AMP-binding protein [Candidatus Zixiibacteriota bacterium]|nr:MAG: AMP-binding protein [candidate division Zixibacteria bacterium]